MTQPGEVTVSHGAGDPVGAEAFAGGAGEAAAEEPEGAPKEGTTPETPLRPHWRPASGPPTRRAIAAGLNSSRYTFCGEGLG